MGILRVKGDCLVTFFALLKSSCGSLYQVEMKLRGVLWEIWPRSYQNLPKSSKDQNLLSRLSETLLVDSRTIRFWKSRISLSLRSLLKIMDQEDIKLSQCVAMDSFCRSAVLNNGGYWVQGERLSIYPSVQKAILEPLPSLKEANGSTFLQNLEILIQGLFKLWPEFPTVCL